MCPERTSGRRRSPLSAMARVLLAVTPPVVAGMTGAVEPEPKTHPLLEARPGDLVSREEVARLAPAAGKRWPDIPIEVVDELGAPPLLPGARLVLIAPTTTDGDQLLLVGIKQNQVTVLFNPNLTESEEKEEDETGVSRHETLDWRAREAFDDIFDGYASLDSRDPIAIVNTYCKADPAIAGRVLGFVAPILRGEARTILLSPEVVAATERKWLPDELKKKLHIYEERPLFETFPFTPDGECILRFRLWSSYWGQIHDVRLPLHRLSWASWPEVVWLPIAHGPYIWGGGTVMMTIDSAGPAPGTLMPGDSRQ
jgi:hypothetical protein